MLSIARQFGSVAKAANPDSPKADTSKSAATHAAGRTFFMPKVPSLFALAGPGRMLAGPGQKSIPLGPTHPALLASDPHENKGRIVSARFRADEDCRNPVGIPDDCGVCHCRLPSGWNWPRRPGVLFRRALIERTCHYRLAATAISNTRKIGANNGGTSHPRMSNLSGFDISPPPLGFRRERNALSHR